MLVFSKSCHKGFIYGMSKSGLLYLTDYIFPCFVFNIVEIKVGLYIAAIHSAQAS